MWQKYTENGISCPAKQTKQTNFLPSLVLLVRLALALLFYSVCPFSNSYSLAKAKKITENPMATIPICGRVKW
jgi:hypothetical protein